MFALAAATLLTAWAITRFIHGYRNPPKTKRFTNV